MASPFAVFRKYQALLLVVFGILIIVVFTIGDSISRLTDDPGSQRDDVIVKWDGTELKESRLQGLLVGRQTVYFALTQVQDAALAKGGFPQFQQQLAFLRRIRPNSPIQRPAMILAGSDLTPLGTVRSMVLAEKAQRMGIVVPDTQIQKHLREVSDGKLKYEEIREILLGGKNTKYPRSLKSIFEVIRQEMLAEKIFTEFFRGTLAMPAGQQFDYYTRSNRQIEAEVIEIPVSDFVDQVADPTADQLQAYFDKYRDQTPLFDNIGGITYASPAPGFKLPHRVSVEYVKVNVDQIVAQAQDGVSEEEIAAYYEENKRRDERMHATDDLPLPEAAGEATGDDTGGDTGGAGDDTGGAGDDTGGAGDDTDEPAAADEEAAPEGGTPPGSDSDSSRLKRPTKISWVGFTDEDPVAEPAKPAAAAATEDTDTAIETEGQAQATDTEAGESPAGGQAAAPERKEPSYKSLDEVRDYVRQRVAERKAAAIIDSKFAAIRKRMNSYATARQYVEEGATVVLKRPDFHLLAEKEGFNSESIELGTSWYFQRDTDIGRSFQQEPRSQTNPFGARTLYTQFIFQEGEQSWWKPLETADDENNRYLSWKTGEAVSKTVELSGGQRDRVVRAWKAGAGRGDQQDTARSLARKRANELAQRLRDGESLDAVADRQPGSRRLLTEAFSWLTSGTAPSANLLSAPQLRLSQIDGIDQAGPEFMREAFGLEVGQVGVAMNHPQTHVYILRATFQNKSNEVLREDFFAHLDDRRTTMQVNSAARLDLQLLQERWFADIDRSMNLVWLNPAARFSR